MNDKKTLFKPKHDLKYVFAISRVAEGNFKNLWRLEVKTPNDTELVEIVDADSLSTVLGKISLVFEAEGL
jgi:hypothetical protein